MSGDVTTIKLGARDYTVIPQGIGRIRRKLRKLMLLGSGGAEITGEIDNDLYDLFKTFIPDVPAMHELLGYESQEQFENDEEPDAAAAQGKEVTLPQIIDAISAIYVVNGADRLVRLGKSVLGPDGLQALLRREVLSFYSDRSLSSPSPSGESPSTTSSTTEPTSAPSEVSPSPDF